MRKILFIFCACLFGALGGVKAYTVDDLTAAGWSKVSAISNDASNEDYVGNFVYVLVDAGSSDYLMSRNPNDINARPQYITLDNPITNTKHVWTIEVRNNGYALRNIESQYYFNGGTYGWDATNKMAATYDNNASFTFTLEDSENKKYSLQRATGTADPGMYVGPWNDGGSVANTGEDVATNKKVGQHPDFYIYRMVKTTYLQRYLQQCPNLTASADSPIDVSYLIVNPTIYQAHNNNQMPDGWSEFSVNSDYRTDENISAGNNSKFKIYKGSNGQGDYFQTIAGIPSGLYRITAAIRGNKSESSKFKAYVYEPSTEGRAESDGAPNQGNPADRTTDYLAIKSGTANVGVHTTSAVGSTTLNADDFRMSVDPYISSMATTLPDGGAMTAGLWYSFSVNTTGYYNLSGTTALNNVIYATGDKKPLSEKGNTNFDANTLLTAGETYYMISSTDNTFAYEGSKINAVAAAYPENGALAAETWYVYSIPMTGDYYFSAIDGVVYTTDGNQSVFIPGTAATSKVSLTKGDNLYVKSSTAQTVKVEGIFYLSTIVDGKTKWLSRMVDHNYASVDDFGLAFKFTTDGNGISYFQFLENDGYYLDDDNNYYVATDVKRGDNTNKWVLETVAGGYKILLQVNQACKLFVADTSTGLVKITNNSDTEYVWNFVTPTEHDAQMQAWVDAQANTAATAGGRSESTRAALEAVLENTQLYEAQDKTSQITGNPTDVADNFQTGGQLFTEQTISELPTGFYRLRYYGYQRISSNDVTYAASQKDADGGVAYVYANGQKTRLMSVMDVASNTPWQEGNDYQGANEKYYPNSTTGAKAAFDAGNYANDVYVYVSDGNLTFGVYNPSNPVCANWAPGYKFELTYYATVTVPVLMQVSGIAKMGTFCAPFDVEIPSGVKAYTLSDGTNDDWVHMDEVEGTTIAAGTPVLLTSDTKYENEFVGQMTVLEPDNSGLLKGVFEKTEVASDDNNYILQYQDSKCAFYIVSDAGIYIGKNRCYLHVEKSSARIAIDREEGGSTAINEVKSSEVEAKMMKDGKYLVKGRIIVVKNGKVYGTNGQILN